MINTIKSFGRSITFCLLLSTGAIITSNGQEQENATGTSFSLQETIQYALENNPEVKNSQLDTRISKADIGVTRADGLPQLDASLELTDYPEQPQQFVPAEFFGGPRGTFQPVAFQPQYNGTAALNVNQMIFNGSYFVGLKASKTYKDLTERQLTQTKVNVTEQVIQSYYTVLVQKKRLLLARQNLKRLDTLLRKNRAMYENGFAEKISVDRVKVNYNNARTRVNSRKRDLEEAKDQLKLQMGMGVEENVHLPASLEDMPMDTAKLNNRKLDYEERPAYRVMQKQKDMRRLDIKNRKANALPTLTAIGRLGANYGSNEFDYGNIDEKWFENTMIGVRLNIPVFSGLRRHYSIKKAEYELQKTRNSIDQMKNRFRMEKASAVKDFKNSLEQLNVQRENKKLARRVYERARIRYEEGMGSYLEVIDAETSLKEAETNYYNALYQALLAQISVEKAMGTLSERIQ